MTGSKLAIADKKEILRLYCETDVSTTQLAKHYGISSSTVLRLLQELMPPDEYRQIVSHKQSRVKKTSKANASNDIDTINQLDLITYTEPKPQGLELDAMASKDKDLKLAKLTKQPTEKAVLNEHSPQKNSHNLAAQSETLNPLENKNLPVDNLFDQDNSEEAFIHEIENLETEDIPDDVVINDIIGDEFDDDADEDLLDEEEDEEDDEAGDLDALAATHYKADPTIILKILPLDEATLPSICYMVIDKVSEVVTRPLQEFRDLGKIPQEETQSLTVPIFENHHIARRFSNHNQRVIKFPGELIYATHGKLAQKGITRLLFDGQVYAL